MSLPAAGGLVEADLRAVRAAARTLAAQAGGGPARDPRVVLFDAPPRLLTIVDGEPDGGGRVLMMVLRPPPGTHPAFSTLTTRERQVTALLASGLTTRQVAAALVVSVATVTDQVRHILAKTRLPSRAAVAAAWRGGSVDGRRS